MANRKLKLNYKAVAALKVLPDILGIFIEEALQLQVKKDK